MTEPKPSHHVEHVDIQLCVMAVAVTKCLVPLHVFVEGVLPLRPDQCGPPDQRPPGDAPRRLPPAIRTAARPAFGRPVRKCAILGGELACRGDQCILLHH